MGWNHFTRWSKASAPVRTSLVVQERRKEVESDRISKQTQHGQWTTCSYRSHGMKCGTCFHSDWSLSFVQFMMCCPHATICRGGESPRTPNACSADRRPWQTCPELQKRFRNRFGPREIASDLHHHDRSTQRVMRGTTSEAGTYRRASTKAKLVSAVGQRRCSVSQPIRELRIKPPIKSARFRKPASRTLNGISCQVGTAPLVNQWESFQHEPPGKSARTRPRSFPRPGKSF